MKKTSLDKTLKIEALLKKKAEMTETLAKLHKDRAKMMETLAKLHKDKAEMMESKKPEESNPFKDWEDWETEGDSGIEKIVGTFEENYITNNLKNYLGEDIQTNGSDIEVSPLSSVDIISNSQLNFDLHKYGSEVLRKASQLAKDMAFTFENDTIPEAFQESQTPGMIEYLKDPLLVSSSDQSYLNELQARLFDWINSFDVASYENLVSLLNEINLDATNTEFRILIAFVSAMLVPKICRAISKKKDSTWLSAKLLKYDIKYFIYNAVVCTPNYKDLMLKLDNSEEFHKITQLVKQGKLKQTEVSDLALKGKANTTEAKEKIEGLRKNCWQIKEVIGFTTLGLVVVCACYYGIKLVFSIKVSEHQAAIDQRKTKKGQET